MKYEVKIRCETREAAESLRELLDGVAVAQIVAISGAEEYAQIDINRWPLAKYLLSCMDDSRWYDREQLGVMVEEMGWSAKSLATVLVKLVECGHVRRAKSLFRKISET